MSVRAMSAVWDHSGASGSDRLVLLAIADSADHDGTNAWPYVATIARKAKVSERTAQRCIRNLVAAGELEVERNMGGMVDTAADRRPNRYRVTVGPLAADRGDTGDTAHPQRGDTPVTPRGDTGVTLGVTPVVERGDTAVSPITSLSVHEQKRGRAPVGAPRPHKIPLPDGWTPNPDHHTLAGSLDLDADDQAAGFRDYHRARGHRRVDWDAEFRRWLRSPYAHPPGGGGTSRWAQQTADEASRAAFFAELDADQEVRT